MKSFFTWFGAAVFAVVGLGAATASADTITFEDIGGTPTTDGQLISTEYLATFGVSFHLLDAVALEAGNIVFTGSPQIAFPGPSRTAFGGPGPADEPDLGDDTVYQGVDQGVGNAFLTDDGLLPPDARPVLINYFGQQLEASGQMLDVDFPEEWTIRAYDQAQVDGNALAGTNTGTVVLDSTSTNAGDGRVTPWAFTGIGNVRSIIMSYTGGGESFIGFAFDNFSPPDLSSFFTSTPPTLDDFVVPEPSTWALTMLGLGALAYTRRRKLQRSK